MIFSYFEDIYNDLTKGPFWGYEVLGNELRTIALALVVFLTLLAIFGIVQKLLILRLRRLSRKTKTDVDDTLINVVDSIKPVFYSYLAFYFAVRVLELGELAVNVLDAILLIAVIYQAIAIFEMLVDYVERRMRT